MGLVFCLPSQNPMMYSCSSDRGSTILVKSYRRSVLKETPTVTDRTSIRLAMCRHNDGISPLTIDNIPDFDDRSGFDNISSQQYSPGDHCVFKKISFDSLV